MDFSMYEFLSHTPLHYIAEELEEIISSREQFDRDELILSEKPYAN